MGLTVTKAPNGKAYDRTEFMPERKGFMQLWADYLDLLKEEEAGSKTHNLLMHGLVKRVKELQEVMPVGVATERSRLRASRRPSRSVSELSLAL